MSWWFCGKYIHLFIYFGDGFKMGFIKEQQKRLAIRFLTWQYEKRNLPVPSRIELEKHAAGIVKDAHRIARERGRNVISIIKEMITDIKR